MAAQFCTQELKELAQVANHHGTFFLSFCVVNFIFSPVAVIGNLLVIRALWKATSMPANLKTLFLSLAFSDLAVGLIAQLMFSVITTIIFRMAANGNNDFNTICPTALTVSCFSTFLLVCASFFNVTAIAVDRLLAISLHLRYQELVTSKRVIIALVSLWLISVVAAALYVSLHNRNNMVAAIIELVGLLLTAVIYVRIYRVVRYHQNQIHSQLQLSHAQAMEMLREKKSALSALFVYVVFVACYLPNLCSQMLLITSITSGYRTSFLVAEGVTLILVLLNSSLNPFLYCWRYREIRGIVKNTVKKIFCMNNTGT